MSGGANEEGAEYAGDLDELERRLEKWGDQVDEHWAEWREEAKEDFAFVAGEQWAEDTIADLEEEGRPPVVFNRVQPVIDAVAGAEIQGRQQVTYLPRQVGATAPNEVLTKGAEWIRDRCDAEQEDSDAARDTFICGMGWTETRVDYDVDPNGQMVVDHVDPLEMGVDPSSRKPNCADARFLRRRKPFSRDAFAEMFGDDETAIAFDDRNPHRPTVADEPDRRYTNGPDGLGDDEVAVDEWQWFERETFYRVEHPDQPGRVVEVSERDYNEVDRQARAAGVHLGGVRQRRRRYWRAFMSNGRLLPDPDTGELVTEIRIGDFTYTAMTGKRDRNRGVWYGLVRPMKDPARFANKLFSQILHILNVNAKGGVMMEDGAVEDQREFEKSWADPGAITIVPPGALSGPGGAKIVPKTPPEYPQGQERLLEYASGAIQQVTGVNEEVLGLAGRDQPGVLEAQRKQAAYGLLATFFDSFKKYRKLGGRKFLKLMQLYMSPETLVHIVGDDGLAQYVPLALAAQTLEFDVIVDDAPAGPNQKQQTFQMLMQLMPLLQNADLPPSAWAEFVRYSPLPTALADKLVKMLSQMQQAQDNPPPQEQALKTLQLAHAQADVDEKNASAEHKAAQAEHLQAQTAAISTGQDPKRSQASDAAKTRLDDARATQIEAQVVAGVLAAGAPGAPPADGSHIA